MRHPGLRGWARATADCVEAFWHDQSISDYLKPYIRNVLERMASEQKKGEAKKEEGKSVFMVSFEKSRKEPTVVMQGMDEMMAMSLAYKSSFNESDVAAVMSMVVRGVRDKKRDFMRLMYRVSSFAAHSSHLIYYARLLPLPREIISELVLRVTKRRAAGLGREALGICRDIMDGEERRRRIIQEVRDFERIWLSRRGISLPQRCVSDYADAFIGGYNLVTSLMPDPQA